MESWDPHLSRATPGAKGEACAKGALRTQAALTRERPQPRMQTCESMVWILQDPYTPTLGNSDSGRDVAAPVSTWWAAQCGPLCVELQGEWHGHVGDQVVGT